jgi:hypothetical protein
MQEVNDFFEDQNVTWQLHTVPIPELEGSTIVAPEIVFRGGDAFEMTIKSAMRAVESSGQRTSAQELTEAIHDLSRRPDPDLTGAVHHAIAALECLAGQILEGRSLTLGELVKRNPDRFPAPLGEAVSKLYGFASDRGRHVSEGKTPSGAHAEFVVSVAAAMITLLLNS